MRSSTCENGGQEKRAARFEDETAPICCPASVRMGCFADYELLTKPGDSTGLIKAGVKVPGIDHVRRAST